MRAKAIADGQQVEIPVLRNNRTVGTQTESQSREWKYRCKRGRSMVGKSAIQSEDVMRTEPIVGKLVSWLSRKAAIALHVPVP